MPLLMFWGPSGAEEAVSTPGAEPKLYELEWPSVPVEGKDKLVTRCAEVDPGDDIKPWRLCSYLTRKDGALQLSGAKRDNYGKPYSRKRIYNFSSDWPDETQIQTDWRLYRARVTEAQSATPETIQMDKVRPFLRGEEKATDQIAFEHRALIGSPVSVSELFEPTHDAVYGVLKLSELPPDKCFPREPPRCEPREKESETAVKTNESPKKEDAPAGKVPGGADASMPELTGEQTSRSADPCAAALMPLLKRHSAALGVTDRDDVVPLPGRLDSLEKACNDEVKTAVENLEKSVKSRDFDLPNIGYGLLAGLGLALLGFMLTGPKRTLGGSSGPPPDRAQSPEKLDKALKPLFDELRSKVEGSPERASLPDLIEAVKRLRTGHDELKRRLSVIDEKLNADSSTSDGQGSDASFGLADMSDADFDAYFDDLVSKLDAKLQTYRRVAAFTSADERKPEDVLAVLSKLVDLVRGNSDQALDTIIDDACNARDRLAAQLPQSEEGSSSANDRGLSFLAMSAVDAPGGAPQQKTNDNDQNALVQKLEQALPDRALPSESHTDPGGETSDRLNALMMRIQALLATYQKIAELVGKEPGKSNDILMVIERLVALVGDDPKKSLDEEIAAAEREMAGLLSKLSTPDGDDTTKSDRMAECLKLAASSLEDARSERDRLAGVEAAVWSILSPDPSAQIQDAAAPKCDDKLAALLHQTKECSDVYLELAGLAGLEAEATNDVQAAYKTLVALVTNSPDARLPDVISTLKDGMADMRNALRKYGADQPDSNLQDAGTDNRTFSEFLPWAAKTIEGPANCNKVLLGFFSKIAESLDVELGEAQVDDDDCRAKRQYEIAQKRISEMKQELNAKQSEVTDLQMREQQAQDGLQQLSGIVEKVLAQRDLMPDERDRDLKQVSKLLDWGQAQLRDDKPERSDIDHLAQAIRDRWNFLVGIEGAIQQAMDQLPGVEPTGDEGKLTDRLKSAIRNLLESFKTPSDRPESALDEMITRLKEVRKAGVDADTLRKEREGLDRYASASGALLDRLLEMLQIPQPDGDQEPAERAYRLQEIGDRLTNEPEDWRSLRLVLAGVRWLWPDIQKRVDQERKDLEVGLKLSGIADGLSRDLLDIDDSQLEGSSRVPAEYWTRRVLSSVQAGQHKALYGAYLLLDKLGDRQEGVANEVRLALSALILVLGRVHRATGVEILYPPFWSPLASDFPCEKVPVSKDYQQVHELLAHKPEMAEAEKLVIGLAKLGYRYGEAHTGSATVVTYNPGDWAGIRTV